MLVCALRNEFRDSYSILVLTLNTVTSDHRRNELFNVLYNSKIYEGYTKK
jgi:hypothetical protein